MHVGIRCGPADGDDGEKTPLLQAQIRQNPMDFRKFRKILFVYARNHIGIDTGFPGKDPDGPERPLETAGTPPHPIVGSLQTVQTDGEGPHPRRHQAAVHLFVIEPPVGNHSPAETAFADLTPDRFQIRAQERFPAGQDHRKVRGPMVLRNRIQCPQEIFEGHILLPAQDRTIAAAVTAVQVAARSTLPEQVVQFVDRSLIGAEKTEQKRIHRALFCKDNTL